MEQQRYQTKLNGNGFYEVIDTKFASRDRDGLFVRGSTSGQHADAWFKAQELNRLVADVDDDVVEDDYADDDEDTDDRDSSLCL
jgi:hypothetical protein